MIYERKWGRGRNNRICEFARNEGGWKKKKPLASKKKKSEWSSSNIQSHEDGADIGGSPSTNKLQLEVEVDGHHKGLPTLPRPLGLNKMHWNSVVTCKAFLRHYALLIHKRDFGELFGLISRKREVSQESPLKRTPQVCPARRRCRSLVR